MVLLIEREREFQVSSTEKNLKNGTLSLNLMESNQKPLKTGVKLMEIEKMTVLKKYGIKIVL